MKENPICFNIDYYSQDPNKNFLVNVSELEKSFCQNLTHQIEYQKLWPFCHQGHIANDNTFITNIAITKILLNFINLYQRYQLLWEICDKIGREYHHIDINQLFNNFNLLFMANNFIQEAKDDIDIVRIQRIFVEEENSKSDIDMFNFEQLFEGLFGNLAPLFINMSSLAYDIVSNVKEMSYYKRTKEWHDITRVKKGSNFQDNINEYSYNPEEATVNKLNKQIDALFKNPIENNQNDFYLVVFDSRLKSQFFYNFPVQTYFDYKEIRSKKEENMIFNF